MAVEMAEAAARVKPPTTRYERMQGWVEPVVAFFGGAGIGSFFKARYAYLAGKHADDQQSEQKLVEVLIADVAALRGQLNEQATLRFAEMQTYRQESAAHSKEVEENRRAIGRLELDVLREQRHSEDLTAQNSKQAEEIRELKVRCEASEAKASTIQERYDALDFNYRQVLQRFEGAAEYVEGLIAQEKNGHKTDKEKK